MTKQQLAIVQNVAQILKDRYSTDVSGHDWFHLERVWKMAKRISKGERVIQFVMEMAALLHDVDDYKFKKDGVIELSETKTILDKVGVIGKEREHILDIVENVSFKGAGVATVQKTREGKIVQDADRLEAMGAIGIARVFTFAGHKGTPIYDPKVKPNLMRSYLEYRNRGTGTAITHFYEKLLLLSSRMNTPQAKKIAEHRHKFLEAYLKEFSAEVEGRV